ncbi:MAG: RNB domain-containing ribonuclease [Candidatus Tectomicrobia bacterium]|uniref:RNB domain-containing ribonuclease n=1 Tax=Tectimicrobiota bacterium TaxID=2528274 RepID=A0A932CMY1_UNCTE|nr:RNB domain-containing ribonuclease [Candidatus Tectomicrobia bacterium]
MAKKGDLLAFYQRKHLVFGLLQGAKGDLFVLFTEEGKEMELEPHKVLMATGKSLDPSLSVPEKKEQLKRLRALFEEEARKVDLPGLWEYLQGEGERFDFDSLAETYLGQQGSPEERFYLFWALELHNPYFKKTTQGYTPRKPEEVEGIIRGEVKGKEREAERERAISELRRVWQEKGSVQIDREAIRGPLMALRGFALYGEESGRAREAQTLMERIGLKEELELIALLIQAGEWTGEEEFLLERYQLPKAPPSARLREESPPPEKELPMRKTAVSILEELSAGAGAGEERWDLTSWETFTIDDETTEVFDDALSLELQDGRFLLGIHIADAAAYVPPGSPLDQEALQRGETVYVPGRRIDMLPRTLIADLSLSQGQERMTITLLATFDRSFNLLDYRLLESIIQVKRHLAYQQTEALTESNPLLALLQSLAQSLRERRKAAGALIFSLPELKIFRNAEGELQVKKVLSNTPGHLIVAEAMILMNQLVATFCRERNIPVLYRVQGPPSREIPEINGNDPLFALKVIRTLSASRISLDPEPHHSLGVPAYTQVTSPIRRYGDLLALRQLQGSLRWGKASYTREELEALYPSLEASQREVKRAERALESYWLLKYLKQNVASRPIPALVSQLGTRGRPPQVYLLDYLLEVPLLLRAPLKLEEGAEIPVRLEGIDLLQGKITAISPP